MSAPFEGAFASEILSWSLATLAPFSSGLAGAGAYRAGPGGLLQGRFGWGNPETGRVLNQPTSDGDQLGVVIPLQSVSPNGGVVGGPTSFGGPIARGTWQTWDRQARAWRLREGLITSIMPVGNFWLRFPGGANYGDVVYASVSDGSAISGALDGAVATSFRVCQNVAAGRLAIVSSAAKFF